ncbi:Exosome non-catalytic core component [Entomophthora muscae]|uniref:Exosome non-catalytic core component n=1 Tax=Entomophthora muscae TaxID=34485 RepID=A0ACC2U5X4_9FUNG|nr:Exosome non-catalytic core component [Entomophthora muscae]
MSRRELISIEGLRVDGRRPTELRKLVSRVGVLADADGSSYIELGNTKILAAIYGPREPRKKTSMLHDRAFLNVEINVSPFSTSERQKRTKTDKRLIELAQSVKQTFEPIVLTQLSSRSQIDIYLQVLQNDGGVLQACINASTLALIHAGVPMSDYVCATSAGFFENTAVLDINQIEESSSQSPEVTVAISPLNGKVILLQIESKLHIEHFKGVVELAIQGCHQVKDLLDKTIRLNTLKLSEQRNSHN